MRFRLLGTSGLRVSEMALGTMTFGEEWGWGADSAVSRAVFDAYVEAGGNFIDTANKYTGGTSERFVGEFVGADRERFVIATKYTLAMREGDPNAAGSHRKNLVQSVEASLNRLGVDYIDLLWVHAWDEFTPVEETMRALDDLVRAGKVLYVGVSDWPAWLVAKANTLAELRGWTPFVALQHEYSLIERTPERDLLPMAHHLGLGVTGWGPLSAGLLTGKYDDRTPGEVGGASGSTTGRLDTVGSTKFTERNLRIAREVSAVGNELGVPASHVAVSWVHGRGVIPIVGSTKPEQIKQNIEALDLVLPPDMTARLDAVSEIELGFPHDFLHRVRGIVYGGAYDEIAGEPRVPALR